MNSQAKKWNQRYKELDKPPDIHPNVKRFAKIAKKSRALDIACGVGQNALYLANLGFEVDAVDIAREGLKYIQDHPKINAIEADITQYELPKEYYDLILCLNFLERSIFSKIIDSLKRDGVLIYETFTYKKENFNPDYTLRKNELFYLLKDLEIIYYELRGEKALAVARKL